MSSCGVFVHKKQSSSSKETIVIQHTHLATDENCEETASEFQTKKLVLGIERLHVYMDSLKDKRIAVVANQTSVVNGVHLVDTLLALNLNVVKIFAPEHGFRGEADAGEHVMSTIDSTTQIPLISLYGNHKKPTPAEMDSIDILLFDIQDVGVRFYTYISTLHYVMEACAENHTQMVVLDRPNPNAHYIDGPVLQKEFRSFVGMHQVPIVYGMTIGEYAMMINGERWLRDSLSCHLWVVPCKNYNHKMRYVLPVAPSPNLKSEQAILLYPSLCLFEATSVSVGRGTDFPFEVYGHPNFPDTTFSFTPTSRIGAKDPMYVNQKCYGYNLSKEKVKRSYELNLSYLIKAKDLLGDTIPFIKQEAFFNRLAGTNTLLEQLNFNWTAREIRGTWKKDLEQFKRTRQRYLLYK